MAQVTEDLEVSESRSKSRRKRGAERRVITKIDLLSKPVTYLKRNKLHTDVSSLSSLIVVVVVVFVRLNSKKRFLENQIDTISFGVA